MRLPSEVAEAVLLSFLRAAAVVAGMGLWAAVVEAVRPSEVAAAGHPWAVGVEVEMDPWAVEAGVATQLVLAVAVEAAQLRQQRWMEQVAGLLFQAAVAAPAMRLVGRRGLAAETGGARSSWRPPGPADARTAWWRPRRRTTSWSQRWAGAATR